MGNNMKIEIKSKKVLIDNEFKPASLTIQNGKIKEILPFDDLLYAENLENALILPGFIDLHSDAIEKEIEPRPGAIFPIEDAIIDLDKKLSIFGITTMFHAIAFETVLPGKIRGQHISENIIKSIKKLDRYLSVNNLIHLRYDISAEETFDIVKNLIEDGYVDLFSVMDHSPGQGQFKTFEKWKKYYSGAYNLDSADLEKLKDKKLRKNRDKMLQLIEVAKKNNIKIASHDDDSVEKIEFIKKYGFAISEFPLSVEVAKKAKESGIMVGMGAPNVVRNGSQCGNISARELIKRKLCDYLCSDYHPNSMLKAVYSIKRDLGYSLEKAFSFITSNPANASGLKQCGRLVKGATGDIVVVDDSRDYPEVIMTICKGKIIYSKRL
jgi:alpha-D-ribose 1-methylphosphonate 5-triphosphate diphosphatase